MDCIAVVCDSHVTAQRSLRVAADLAAASGARLVLAYAPPETPAPVGMGAVALLSGVLFAPQDLRSPVPTFGGRSAAGPGSAWIDELRGGVDGCWTAKDANSLVARVAAARPDLVVTSQGTLARKVIKGTGTAVWRVPRAREQRSWFSLKKFRCGAQCHRSISWARELARKIGVEVEIAGPWSRQADLVVVARERVALIHPVLASSVRPLVVV